MMFGRKVDNVDGILKKIARMREPHRAIGMRLHETIMQANPELKPTLWYGAPAYTKAGEVLCFFRADGDFMTVGLTEKAHFSPDENATDLLMPSAWFLTSLDQATEARLAEIIRKATR